MIQCGDREALDPCGAHFGATIPSQLDSLSDVNVFVSGKLCIHGVVYDIALGACVNLQFSFSSVYTEHTISLVAGVDAS